MSSKKYIRVSNGAGFVNRLALEKLGLSTKRDDESTIGQFGSGIKYAPIAALRMGLEWYFAGEDEQGQYVLKYDVKQENGIDCVVYNYGDYVKDSSFTIDAGVFSWEDEFQIYREAVSNAIDESVTNGVDWDVCLVDAETIAPVKNEFLIFISASPAMINIYENHDRYYSLDRSPVFCGSGSNKSLKIYEAYDDENGMNVYFKGVNVFQSHRKSLFDYEIHRIKLNEQRSVDSESFMNYRIMNTIHHCDVPSVVKRYLLSSERRDDYYEFTEIHRSDYYRNAGNHAAGDVWKEVWISLYGDNSVCLSHSDLDNSRIINHLRRLGKNLVIHEDIIHAICKDHGITTIEDVLNEEIQYDIDPCLSNYPRLEEAISIASRYEPGLLNVPGGIATFTSDGNSESQVLGMFTKQSRQILIDKNHALTGLMPDIIATLIHEYDHYSSGLGDGYDAEGRMFRDVADARIGKFVYDHYKDAPIAYVKDNSVVIPIESVTAVGGSKYSIKNVGGKYVMSIGNKVFVLQGEDIVSKNGSAKFDSDGKSMVINVPNVVSIKGV